ncbi:MAG: alcohol dehydrogenase, class [Holophagaceae bacterium]|nr:alcohol dehydrogenase, class [Holophagaceae bacterium]
MSPELQKSAELRKFLAPEFIQGAGALGLVGRYATNLGAERVLVVSDPGVRKAGWTRAVTEALEGDGLEWTIFDEVSPNPRTGECAKGVDCFRATGSNLIVAIGGGSPMDCAKGIAVLAANGGAINDFEGVDEVRKPGPPLICLPTTAGTAADVSQFAIISNREELRKLAIISRKVVPDVALIDPRTLETADAFLRACTGMDALTHAVEALVSNASSPLTDLLALEAAGLAAANLPLVTTDLADPAPMEQMMQASLLAGLAFSNASLGAVHAMAHSLGGLLDLPHGLCNAILLPHVVAYNFEAAPEAYGKLSLHLGLEPSPTGKARQTLVDALQALNERVGIHQTLGQLGVSQRDIPSLAAKAMRDPCLVTNPRRPSHQEIEAVYAAAL